MATRKNEFDKQTLFGVIVGTVLTLAIFAKAFQTENPNAYLGTVFGVLVVSFSALLVGSHVSVAIHELGHLVAGRLVGFKFYAMRIGPLYWWKPVNTVRFTLRPHDRRSYGFVSMGPTDDKQLLSRYRWFIVGGPTASLVLVGLFYLLTGPPSFLGFTRQSKPDIFTSVIGLMFSITLLYAIIPFRYRGFYNDGANLLLSFFSPKTAELRALSLKWSAEVSSGSKCAEWDKATLAKMVALATAPFDRAMYQLYLGNAQIYSGEVPEGLENINRSYEILAKPTGLMSEFEAAIAADTAFVRAFFADDVPGAKEALLKTEQLKPLSQYGIHRARAAIAMRESDLEAVRANAVAAKEWLDTHADKGRPAIQAAYQEMDELVVQAQAVGQKVAVAPNPVSPTL